MMAAELYTRRRVPRRLERPHAIVRGQPPVRITRARNSYPAISPDEKTVALRAIRQRDGVWESPDSTDSCNRSSWSHGPGVVCLGHIMC
jgi:hypothetical protein